MNTYEENTTFNCPVRRERGDADTVTLQWQILDPLGELADEDFVLATGTLEFIPGERLKVRKKLYVVCAINPNIIIFNGIVRLPVRGTHIHVKFPHPVPYSSSIIISPCSVSNTLRSG